MTAAAAACEALLEMEGQRLGNRSSLGERQGPCQFIFQTLQQLVRMVLYLACKGQRPVGQRFAILAMFLWRGCVIFCC